MSRTMRITLQLSEDEIPKVMLHDVILTNVEEVTPEGWTRRAPEAPKRQEERGEA